MATTRGFEIVNSDKLNRLATRFAKPESALDSAPQPPAKNDLFDRINIEQKIQLDAGFDATIDVQPDFRFILLTLIFHVNKLYLLLEQKNRPLLTPPSLIAYCLFLVNGFFLVCDKYGRHTPSQHARFFLNDIDGQQMLETLLRCYVPPFILDLFRGLAPTVLPRRPGIEVIPSFAGFSFEHDFGRIFPPQMFTIAHTIAASVRGNSEPNVILQQWFDTSLTTDGSISVRVGHLIGAGINDSGRYENWLQTACIGVFNPVVLRSLSQRPVFQRIPYTAHSTSMKNTNPYVFLLNADEYNVPSSISFIESISDLVKSDLNASSQLGGIFSLISGINIVTHAYSDYSLPTWHFKSLGMHDTVKSAADFASSLQFMSLNRVDKKTTVVYPSDASSITQSLYLLDNKARDYSLDPDNLVLFNTRMHVFNPWRLFDPYDYLPSKFAYPVVCGLLIETHEIDGFGIPQPNLRSSLREDNSQFLQSALRLDCVRTAINASAHPIVRRSVTRDDKQKVHVSFYDMARNRLGIPSLTVSEASVPSSPKGFDIVHNVRGFFRMFNTIGYRTGSTSQSSSPHKEVTAWSCYRFIDPSAPIVTAESEIDYAYVYFLLNFRTMFGTDVTLAQIEHGAKLIPIA